MGIGPMTRVVFLDRDGVVNEAVMRDGKPYPPAVLSELRISDDAPQALGKLKSLGLPLIIVTNQPDVARGTQSIFAVEAIHDRLRSELPIDAFFCCYHDDSDRCSCRKPQPGLILEAAARFGADLSLSFLIGDRWRDIDAGHAAGCQTVWIDRGYREQRPHRSPTVRVNSLQQAALWIETAVLSGIRNR
jgi:D-glycero-D-manno-heptose 1,7-bisphosphate phosphatase